MQTEHFIAGKDASLESTINGMQAKLEGIGFHVEERSWLNPVDGIWSVHVRDRDCPLLFTNGKGASKECADYRQSLEHLYGVPTVQQAEALFTGEQRFFNIEAPGTALKGCDMHHRLLAAYAKLQAQK